MATGSITFANLPQIGANAYPLGGSAFTYARTKQTLTTLVSDTGDVTEEELAEAENPFDLPQDEEIFRLRETERNRKATERDEQRLKPVSSKTTFSSRMQTTISPEMAEANHMRWKNKLMTGTSSMKENTLAELATQTLDHRHKNRENIREFINKKREIFLVQMSLDTKKAEIRKLEERAIQREAALKKSETMLEEDAQQFDDFLKDNDKEVQEAIKAAEAAVKEKQYRVQEIKRLNNVIAALKSEMNKYEEQLEECKKYKDFLDDITPGEWFEKQEKKRQHRHQQKIDAWKVECEGIRNRKTEAQNAKTKAENDFANARTQQEAERAEQEIKETTQALKEISLLQEPPEPEEEFDDELEQEMFFQEPGQLLKIFGELEESNLFLIQNTQESEEAMEDVKNQYRKTKHKMDAEVETLNEQIKQLHVAITFSRDKVATLLERTIENTGNLSGMGNSEVTLDQLQAKIAEVYNRCGFEHDPSMSTQQMLTNIEGRLEEFLAFIAQCPPEFVEQQERGREKERRHIAREEKIEQQHREHEARMKRALERAAAPVYKKTGKPVMFRSTPIRKKVVVEEEQKNDEEAQLEYFLARELM